MPQSQSATNPRHQKEEKKNKNWRVQNKQTNAREAHKPALLSSPGEVNRVEKEQGMTQHEMLRSKNYTATKIKNHTRTSALKRSVAYATGGFKILFSVLKYF